MDDERTMISLRMDAKDIQELDDFLKEHPNLGGRSMFIRTVVREYIDRDADVSQSNDEVTVRLANAELEAIDSLIADGLYVDRQDAVRMMVRQIIVDKEFIKETSRNKYAAASSQSR